MKIAFIIGGVIGLLLALIVIGKDSRPTNEKIADSCQREFGNRGKDAVQECILRTSLRYLSDQEKAKDDRAYGRIR